MHIHAGQTIALIGPTGHGKSTILNLLATAIVPTSGQYFVGASQQKLLTQQSFYDEMVYISQRTYIFAGTLRENLLMNTKHNDTQCLQALEDASLMDWYSRLPDGLDTVIGEGGRGLSGGEQQRLAIARAFLKQPSIVFFDEPTAHLDSLTEAAISASIQKLCADATSVIISHRYESIKCADYIYVINNGKIVDGDKPENLQHPLYQQMKEGIKC
ncbi:MAG: ATP-binding cassette domain-containing protein [Lysinibacillus sp.]